jgi:hypothetical protein
VSLAKNSGNKTLKPDNRFWIKETFLDGMVVLHTIKCKKNSDEVIDNLRTEKYKIENVKKDPENHLSDRNDIYPNQNYKVKVDKIERLVFKSEVAREKNSFFFRATDCENIYQLGDSYYKDFKTGLKHLSFANVNSPDSQMRSIIGVASYIYYFESLKILIITDSIDSIFLNYLSESKKSVEHISVYPDFQYEAYKHEGLYYLQVNEILEKSKSHQIVGLEYLLRNIIDDYDVVLYDLPSAEVRKSKYEFYFPLLQIIQNVTITLNLKNSTFNQVDDLKKHFTNYKIKLKGCVIDEGITVGTE